jgi:hypothetical protein
MSYLLLMQILNTYKNLFKKVLCIIFCIASMRLWCYWVKNFYSINKFHNLKSFSRKFIFIYFYWFHYIFMWQTICYFKLSLMSLFFFFVVFTSYFNSKRKLFFNIVNFITHIYLCMITLSNFFIFDVLWFEGRFLIFLKFLF